VTAATQATTVAEQFASELEWSRRCNPMTRDISHARHALACAVAVQTGIARSDAELGATIREIWALYEQETR
jgi:hypothetical protein